MKNTINDTDLGNLFESIFKGNSILFLGAGASVLEEKKYLSSQLIDYYRDIKSISYIPENGNIVDFVDKVFSVKEYDRNDFDFQVANWLKNNLKCENHHKIIINTPWLSIITTNVDLLIDNAIEKFSNSGIKYSTIKNKNEFAKSSSNGFETKYIKIHGCISDISKYPLLFSSRDFENNENYYKKVFSNLSDLSDNVKIVMIGYSFNDKFGEMFLNKYTEKLKLRESYLIDPYAKDDEFNINYFKTKNIKIVKLSAKDFFTKYDNWCSTYNRSINKNNQIKFVNGNDISGYLQNRLKSFLIPINDSYKTTDISAKQFYYGEEPNYNIINSNFDIIKKKKTNEIYLEIENLFNENKNPYPFVFLKGSYGTGKTTFTYRLIHKFVVENNDLMAFEFLDVNKIDLFTLIELIDELKETKRIIFYTNHTELDLIFKKIREVRGSLSAQQFSDKKIIFIQSIRENILEKFKTSQKPIINEFDIDCKFTEDEIREYIEKLQLNNVINLRSAKEKEETISNLKVNALLSDQLALSLSLIKDGNHHLSIIDTYKSFSFPDTKKAFLYTALIYRFGIKMPISLLKEIIDISWDEFIEKVVKIDGKGIFIQERISPDQFLKPDLYFKIRHRIIAEKFVNEFIQKRELYNKYEILINNLPENDTAVYLFINLIKSIQKIKIFDQSKINSLYDKAYKKLRDFERFIIYYSKNLENRRSINDILKGLRIIEDIERENTLISNNNSRIIHRKGCLNFALSKKHFHNDSIEDSIFHMEEAIEFFLIKLAKDPTSIFSYKEFIYSLSWKLIHFDLSPKEKIKIEFQIKNLIEKGIDNLQDGINELIKIKDKLNVDNWESYLKLRERYDNLIDNYETRPYALLIQFEIIKYYPEKIDSIDFQELLREIENYSHNDEVCLFLFNYYGNNLNYYDIRMKFFDLLKNNQSLQDSENLSFLFYNFTAEIYNGRFRDAFEFQREISYEYRTIKKTPIFWLEQNCEDKRLFDGVIHKNKKGYYEYRVAGVGSNIYARIDNHQYDFSTLIGKEINAFLFFNYSGIWAKLIL